MEMLGMYIASILRKIQIYTKSKSLSRLHANVAQSALLWIRPSSDTPKGSHIQTAYVGELESSDPTARHDLLVLHFIDPPFYTNKLAVLPRLPTSKESYPDATELLSFFSSVSEIDDIPCESSARDIFPRAKTRAGTR